MWGADWRSELASTGGPGSLPIHLEAKREFSYGCRSIFWASTVVGLI